MNKLVRVIFLFSALSCIVSLSSVCLAQADQVRASADPQNVCVGSTLQLRATGVTTDSTYQWTMDGADFSTDQNPTIPGPPQGAGVPAEWDTSDPYTNRGSDHTFQVTRTVTSTQVDTNGMTNTTIVVSTDKVIVTVHPLPPCTISGPDTMCARNYGVVYTAPKAYQQEVQWSYQWSVEGNGGIIGSPNNYYATVYSLTPGSITVAVRVTSPWGCASGCTSNVVVNDSAQLDGLALPNGVVGASYNHLVGVTGGTQPYTFSTKTNSPLSVALGNVNTNALPPGLTLNPLTGRITGTPTVEGSFTFPIGVSDVNHCCYNSLNPNLIGFQTDEYQCDGTYTMYTLVVNCGNLTLLPAGLPRGDVGKTYNATITVMGGAAPGTRYLWTEGNLPPGLNLLSGGQLLGTPTAFGTYNFKVTAVDTNNSCIGQQSYVLQVGCVTNMNILLPGGVISKYLPEGEIRKHYPDPFDSNSVLQLIGTNGTPPYAFAVTSGSLPEGLTLSSDGALSGIPTSGNSVFVVTVTDANGCQTNRTYYMLLRLTCPDITLSPTNLIRGTVGVPYNATITASNGIGASTFAITAGALPPGLSLSTSGVVAGEPTAGGEYHFIITSTDTDGCTASWPYTMPICDAITLSPASLTNGVAGVAYSQPLAASGESGPYTVALSTGALPLGMTLTNGVLTGTPTAAGNNTFMLMTTSTNGCQGYQNFSLTVQAIADLSVSVSEAPNPVLVGSNLTYSVTITNKGPSTATGVVVTDVLPVGTSFVSASTGCQATNNTAVCNIGTLLSGASATATYVVTGTKVGAITNIASVVGVESDPYLTNNTATTVSTVAAGALGFSAPAVVVSGNAAAGVLEVVRTGDISGAMSVNYATADESAVAGVDYVATSGTLAFGPGELTQSIAVPILPMSELSTKTVSVNLSTPTGGAALGTLRQAKLSIVRGANNKKVTVTDVDGDIVTIQLAGAGGVEVALAGVTNGPISQIRLLNTDLTSVLNVKVRRVAGGDGQVAIGGIVGTGGLRNLNARAANLVNGDMNLDGPIGNVKLNAVQQARIVSPVSIGVIRVNELTDALVAAGYTPSAAGDPMAGGTFAPGGLIRSVGAAKFARSVVAAAIVGSVKFGQADVNGGGKQCGVIAGESIASVSLKTPAFKWDRHGAEDQARDDFHVRH
jgi:uncharacterized repeat protein (TIGR01451 family)